MSANSAGNQISVACSQRRRLSFFVVQSAKKNSNKTGQLPKIYDFLPVHRFQ